MVWYTILFITVWVLFTVKLIMSWTAGDFDMDIDFDGLDDFDVSGAFSFKGLLHFLVGFSSYLFLRSNVNGFVQFDIIDYVLAIIIGIILMFVLFYGYMLVMKANSQSQDYKDLIDNCTGFININLGNGRYIVNAYTQVGTINIEAIHDVDNLIIGTQVRLKRNKQDNISIELIN